MKPLARPTSFAVVEATAVRSMCLELDRAERLATILRWRRYVPLEHFATADRVLLRRHREIQSSLKALRADYDRNPSSNARVQHRPRASTCPACHK